MIIRYNFYRYINLSEYNKIKLYGKYTITSLYLIPKVPQSKRKHEEMTDEEEEEDFLTINKKKLNQK